MSARQLIEAEATKRIQEAMGPLFGSPEYLADPVKRARSEKRQRDAAEHWAKIAVEVVLELSTPPTADREAIAGLAEFQEKERWRIAQVQAYNTALALVNDRRERGDWTVNVDHEYRRMHKAEREANIAYDAMRPAILALTAPNPTEGWKLVPEAPTPEMIEAGRRGVSLTDNCRGDDPTPCDYCYDAGYAGCAVIAQGAYAAMLKSAPEPQDRT